MDHRYFAYCSGNMDDYNFTGLSDNDLFTQHSVSVSKTAMCEDLLADANADFYAANALAGGHDTPAAKRHIANAKQILKEAEGEYLIALGLQTALRNEINTRYPEYEEN